MARCERYSCNDTELVPCGKYNRYVCWRLDCFINVTGDALIFFELDEERLVTDVCATCDDISHGLCDIRAFTRHSARPDAKRPLWLR